MKIAVYTLTHQRDKYIDEMLAEELRLYGHEVVIRNYIYGARESICYEKPDVIIHPMPGGEYKIDTIKKCRQWGVQVIVRRGEAGMGRKEFEQLDDNRRDIILGHWDYSPYVDLELVWGREFADIIHDEGWMDKDKIKACGAFAFDPYFKKINRVEKPRRKTVLFATGFSTADCRQEYCESGLPEESDYHEELYRIHSNARDVWLAAIEELIKWFEADWLFELKVRPGESVNEYKEKLPSCVKIHPEDSPSSEVLRDIDVLVHSGSTMAIEAHLLNIPSFNFCNVNPDPLLASVSPMLDSYDELEWNLSRAIVGQSNINESVYGELQKHLYGEIDGKACERAAKYIHEHIRKSEKNIPNTWPKEPVYLTDDVHLNKQEDDVRWTCPCCRNIFWGEKVGVNNCPYCNMVIERTIVKPGSTAPRRTVTLNTKTVLK